MAFSSLTEDRDSPQGKFEARGKRTYVRNFTVRMTSKSDSPLAVRDSPGLPKVGTFFQTSAAVDMGATCRSVECAPVEMKRASNGGSDLAFWRVKCTYDTGTENEGDNGEDNNNDDPFARRPDIALGFQRFTEPVWTATYKGKWQGEVKLTGGAKVNLSGKLGAFEPGSEVAVMNSAEVPFTDPPIERDAAYLSLSVERNMKSVDAEDAAKLINSVNKANFKLDHSGLSVVAKPGTARLVDLRAREEWVGNERGGYIRYWRVAYEFLIKPQVSEYKGGTWDKLISDFGMHAKADEANPPDPNQGFVNMVVIKDKEKEMIVEPVHLNGAGKPLGEFETPYSLQYQLYPLETWSRFDLMRNLPHNVRR